MAHYQAVGDESIKRTDHCWMKKENGTFKCILCGAICNKPPRFPTQESWNPLSYEKLTNEERNLCPFEQRREG